MDTPSARIRSLLVLLLPIVFLQCQDVPPDASGSVYVSADRSETARPNLTGCAFRYTILNTYGRIDDASQREAIRAGFALWQKVNPNVGFLELPDRAEVRVEFADPTIVQVKPFVVSEGLVHGLATVAGRLRQDADGSVTILLSNAYAWDKASLTKAIAYHAGLYLGMATSSDSRSLMSPVFTGQLVAPTKSDSLSIRSLYSSYCKDLSGVCFLPFSLKVSGPITKTVKLDKQGTIEIKASGLITVGVFVGISGPEGKDGLFGFAIPQYSLIESIPHAALIYKVDNEVNFHYWKGEPTFKTNNRQYITLTFGVNDKNLTDNSGAYDVTVDYQK